MYYFKIESKNDVGISSKTDVLAVIPSVENSEILIVDGVERRSLDAIVQYDYPLSQLGFTFSSASNEAVINDIVDLKNYKLVIWMLLDDSTVDDTFNKSEQDKVKDFIDNNGAFIVSGNEIGWDLVEKGDSTDKLFYENYFKATYIADFPTPNNRIIIDNNNQQYNIDDNSYGILDNEFPDVIKAKNGSRKILSYDGVSNDNGYAGVSYRLGKGGVEYLGFAIESVYDDNQRKDLLNYLLQKYSIFTLPEDNFSVQVVSETCPNKNNGQLIITAQTSQSYETTINGTPYTFTDSLTVDNLSPGTYSFCITVTGESYEQCFEVAIKQGVTVSGKSSISSNRATIEIEEGTAPFIIYVNGKEVLETRSPVFNVAVKHGDLLEVKTSKTCEGVYSKTIVLLEGIVACPNPTSGVLEIALPVSDKEVIISLYSINSQLISRKVYPIINGKVRLNIANKPTGLYIAKVHLDKPVTLKIIKQ